MKIEIIPSSERGTAEEGWLHSKFSFSFANYYNPKRMGFGALRVLNEDFIDPGHGFGMHPHNNMEIVTVVLEGALEHRDSMGNHGVIKSGDIQRMSAGSGIVHSEFNHSKKEKVHLLQIWIHTKERDIKPGYEQKNFPENKFKDQLNLIVSGEKNNEAVYIHQDAKIFLGHFSKNQKAVHTTSSEKNGLYLFLIEGELTLSDKTLKTGDAAGIRETNFAEFRFNKQTHLLLLEVPYHLPAA